MTEVSPPQGPEEQEALRSVLCQSFRISAAHWQLIHRRIDGFRFVRRTGSAVGMLGFYSMDQ